MKKKVLVSCTSVTVTQYPLYDKTLIIWSAISRRDNCCTVGISGYCICKSPSDLLFVSVCFGHTYLFSYLGVDVGKLHVQWERNVSHVCHTARSLFKGSQRQIDWHVSKPQLLGMDSVSAILPPSVTGGQALFQNLFHFKCMTKHVFPFNLGKPNPFWLVVPVDGGQWYSQHLVCVQSTAPCPMGTCSLINAWSSVCG